MSVEEGTEEICKMIPDCDEEDRVEVHQILTSVYNQGVEDEAML